MRRLLCTGLAGVAAALIPTLSLLASLPAAAAAGALMLPAAGPPAPPLERFGVRLLDVPVSEAGDPRALRYIIDSLPTGSVIHRRILVVNREGRTAHFTVYPDAAGIAHGYFIGDAGATRSELTSWITVRHPALTLAAGASATDVVTIRVPAGATRGEHYGVIWVQQAAPAQTASGLAITEVARVGVRIYLAVGRGGAPPTSFVITSLTGRRTAAGQPLLEAHVRNTGGRAVDLSGKARLTRGPAGVAAGPFREQQVVTLAPGQSGDVLFGPPQKLPDGPWHASVTLVSGFTKVTVRAVVDFTLPGSSTAWLSRAAMIFGGTAVAGLGVIGTAAMQRRRLSGAARRRNRR